MAVARIILWNLWPTTRHEVWEAELNFRDSDVEGFMQLFKQMSVSIHPGKLQGLSMHAHVRLRPSILLSMS